MHRDLPHLTVSCSTGLIVIEAIKVAGESSLAVHYWLTTPSAGHNETVRQVQDRLDQARGSQDSRAAGTRPAGVLWRASHQPSQMLDRPRPSCFVCSKSKLVVSVDTTTFRLRDFFAGVLRAHLGMNTPSIDVVNREYAGVSFGTARL